MIYNLSLQIGHVPFHVPGHLVPVPKGGRPAETKDFTPVALTSHAMKTLEGLLLRLLRPQVQHAVDPLQFAYQEDMGVEDPVLYMLQGSTPSWMGLLGLYVSCFMILPVLLAPSAPNSEGQT